MARKILLADDSVTAQNMGRKILADAGYEVITVNNGSAALKKIAEQKPDLIVLDVYMPGYSGLEVCQRLKEAQETSRVPVLLTVGKLEPFKPEEAKRARADGFIVKPFEASELLSALSKLEDKIVPRPESSKPGRFARANAALDEAKHDKTVAVDEDSGWRNRIVFPKKKSKAEAAQAAQDEDDSSFYNPMNKDLRTVVEHRPSVPPHAARQEGHTTEEDRVDLGALAPEGLPKDVTPEEIAALAAAAAQVKGKIAEARFAEGKFAEEESVASKVSEPVFTEAKPELKTEATPAVEFPQEITAAAPPVATFAEQKSEEKIEAKVEAKSEEKAEEKTAASEKSPAVPPEAGSVAHPSHDDLMAAIAALEPDSVPSPGASSERGSGNGSWLHDAAGSNADEPVTMAVAAAAAAGLASSTSRWTAVAVALAPEESAVSLELEMEKASAALAAAEAIPAPVVTASRSDQHAESQPQETQFQAASPQEIQPASAQSSPLQEASSPAEAAHSEAVQSLSTAGDAGPRDHETTDASATNPDSANASAASAPVSNAAAEAITEAVKELEAVAAAYAEQMKPAAAAPEPALVQHFKVPQPDVPPAVAASLESRMEDSPALPSSPIETPAATPPALEVPNFEPAKPDAPQATQQEPSQPEIEAPKNAQVKNAEVKNEEIKNEEVKSEVPPPVVVPVAATEEAPVTAAAPSDATPTFVNEVPAESASAQQVSPGVVSSHMISSESEIVSSEMISSDMAAVLGELAAGGIFDMAKKESEIAATTAAAWASWRRIRETGDAKAAPAPAESVEKEDPAASAPRDAAAMAVAAGAEKAPEGSHASEPDSDDIAGIVDSVLADLRPKIVEEISRKMGKKK
ncbi:MAG: response regulator [Candidatus Sulfotelmatobacter sp.]